MVWCHLVLLCITTTKGSTLVSIFQQSEKLGVKHFISSAHINLSNHPCSHPFNHPCLCPPASVSCELNMSHSFQPPVVPGFPTFGSFFPHPESNALKHQCLDSLSAQSALCWHGMFSTIPSHCVRIVDFPFPPVERAVTLPQSPLWFLCQPVSTR